MKRWQLLTLCLFVCFLGIFFIPPMIRNRVLASKRIQINGESVVLKLIEKDNHIQAWAYEQRLWSHGWSSMVSMGDANTVGRENPRIDFDEQSQSYRFTVGSANISIHPGKKSFVMRTPVLEASVTK